MINYWIRHRLFATIIIFTITALVSSSLFVFQYINQRAYNYNSLSIYKNTNIDFIVPEPSFEQVEELPGTNGIDKVFPFYLTKVPISVNGRNRTTTVLITDQFNNVGFTMYNDKRLIEISNLEFDNYILVDWQFCHDTSAKIGDTVSLSLGGNMGDFRIYAIYETNSVYDGGAILAKISEEQKKDIQKKSSNNGYSAMYVSTSDYNICKKYLTEEYRPLGRLKNRNQFNDENQYQIHYDAIMSSGFANEITDFRVKSNSLDKECSTIMVYIGAILSFFITLVFNVAMSKRGCESGYFKKYCIPKGVIVKPYYILSFIFESSLFIVVYIIVLFAMAYMSKSFISQSVYDIWLFVVPVTVVVAEILSFTMNNYALDTIKKKSKGE